jgi:hypothetical protein
MLFERWALVSLHARKENALRNIGKISDMYGAYRD